MRASCSSVFALTIVLSTAASARAGWCTDFGDAIFCDDFDRYCKSPPAAPEICGTDSDASDASLRGVWSYNSWNYNTNSLCGSNMKVEDIDEVLGSQPWGGRAPNSALSGGQVGQNTVNLSGYIYTAIPGTTTVNGSDAQPLVLTFTMGALAYGLPYSNGYMQLTFNGPGGDVDNVNNPDQSQAPTDFVMAGADDGTGSGCKDCYHLCPGPDYSAPVAWPTICQQDFPNPACPPLQTFVRKSLALGALAMLDNNPCHCENPAEQVPTNYHLSYYDGLKWRILKEGIASGSGDFVLGDLYDTVVLTIKTSTVDVYHKAHVDGVWLESWAYGLPRQYTGEFKNLRAGTDVSCQLNSDTYSCSMSYKNGHKVCKRMGEDRCDTGGYFASRAKYVTFDNVALAGGVGNIEIGACCRNDATCVETDVSTCEQVLGGHFQGPATTCAATVCCAYPFADADHDGDVDQDDFGGFQLCYNGSGAVPTGCFCYDRNADGRVDSLDFVAFTNCFTEANIPWAQTLTPNCAP